MTIWKRLIQLDHKSPIILRDGISRRPFNNFCQNYYKTHENFNQDRIISGPLKLKQLGNFLERKFLLTSWM